MHNLHDAVLQHWHCSAAEKENAHGLALTGVSSLPSSFFLVRRVFERLRHFSHDGESPLRIMEQFLWRHLWQISVYALSGSMCGNSRGLGPPVQILISSTRLRRAQTSSVVAKEPVYCSLDKGTDWPINITFAFIFSSISKILGLTNAAVARGTEEFSDEA